MKTEHPTVEEMISKAVAAGRIAGGQQSGDIFNTTEKRLYAYPIIQLKVSSDKELIEDILQYGAPGRSKSIVRYSKLK